MFAHGFNESNASAISLVDISYPVFIALVLFLYTDNIPPPSVEALVLPLLQQVRYRVMPCLLCRFACLPMGEGNNNQAALYLLSRGRVVCVICCPRADRTGQSCNRVVCGPPPGLHRLSCLCQRQLEGRLDAGNVSAMLEAADTHGAMPLRAACLRYILVNFSSVSRTNGFLSVRTTSLTHARAVRLCRCFHGHTHVCSVERRSS